MIDMQFGLAARQRHYERIQHALGPRPERYGSPSPRRAQRSFALSSRIGQLARWPTLLMLRVTSRRA